MNFVEGHSNDPIHINLLSSAHQPNQSADRFCIARLQTDGTIKCGAPNRPWTRDDDIISVELKEILSTSGYCACCSSYLAEAQTLVIQSFDISHRTLEHKSITADGLQQQHIFFIENICLMTSRSFNEVVNAISSVARQTADNELESYLRQILQIRSEALTSNSHPADHGDEPM